MSALENARSAPIDEGGYSPLVRRLFETLPGAGRPPEAAGWAAGEARDPLTATHVRWYLRAEGGRVAEARYEVRGCPHTIAAAALLAGRLVGQPAGSPQVDLGDLAATLEAPPEKLGRLFVIEDAVRRAALLSGSTHA
jgi:NifU-like protein involved in Fe-S cluster formation